MGSTYTHELRGVRIPAGETTVVEYDSLGRINSPPQMLEKATRIPHGVEKVALLTPGHRVFKRAMRIGLEVCLDDEEDAWFEVWDYTTGGLWGITLVFAEPVYIDITTLIAPILQLGSTTDFHKFHGAYLRPLHANHAQSVDLDFWFAFTRE